MTGRQLKIMMEGLITTVVEKICVLGWEDAKEDVEKLVDLVEDLEMFWDSDGRLTETDWVAEILMAIENAGGVV
ncbi:MAG TPA: hypothetical protein VFD08_05255 [Clostridia bacterium]|nr:hypothetical protein [Clostridia bacterium]